jgi:hypothetical protein
VVDLLDEEQLKLVVQGLDLICSAEKEIQRTFASMQTID